MDGVANIMLQQDVNLKSKSPINKNFIKVGKGSFKDSLSKSKNVVAKEQTNYEKEFSKKTGPKKIDSKKTKSNNNDVVPSNEAIGVTVVNVNNEINAKETMGTKSSDDIRLDDMEVKGLTNNLKVTDLMSKIKSILPKEMMSDFDEKFTVLKELDLEGLQSSTVLEDVEKQIKEILLSVMSKDENPLLISKEDVLSLKQVLEELKELLMSENNEGNGELEEVKEEIDSIIDRKGGEQAEGNRIFEEGNVLSAIDVEKRYASKETKMEDLPSEQSIISKFEGETGKESKVEVIDFRTKDNSRESNASRSNFSQILFDKMDLKVTDKVEIAETKADIKTDIVEQILEKTTVVLKNNKSMVLMKLNPEHLGKVLVRLSSQNGIVKGSFTVENNVVKEALERNIVMLKQQLEESGVKIDKIEVTISSSNDFAGEEQSNRQFNRKKQKNRVSFNVPKEEDNFSVPVSDYTLDDSTVNYSA